MLRPDQSAKSNPLYVRRFALPARVGVSVGVGVGVSFRQTLS